MQELSTVALPGAFLPLACTANLAKNLAAVAASSTRAPIYRTFALQNNLAGMARCKSCPVCSWQWVASSWLELHCILLCRYSICADCSFLNCTSLYVSKAFPETDGDMRCHCGLRPAPISQAGSAGLVA